MTNDEINPILIYPDNQTAPISRRDFFAAHALNGLLQGLHGKQPWQLPNVVTEAVVIADFLIDKLDNTDND